MCTNLTHIVGQLARVVQERRLENVVFFVVLQTILLLKYYVDKIMVRISLLPLELNSAAYMGAPNELRDD